MKIVTENRHSKFPVSTKGVGYAVVDKDGMLLSNVCEFPTHALAHYLETETQPGELKHCFAVDGDWEQRQFIVAVTPTIAKRILKLVKECALLDGFGKLRHIESFEIALRSMVK